MTVKATCTQDQPTGIVGGFTWNSTRLLDGVTATLRARAPTLGVRNRDLIRLSLGGQPIFYGPVVECPHPRDPNFGDVKLVGASDLLTRRVIGNEIFENVDVAVIVRALVQQYRHPAITYDESLIPLTGRTLTKFSMPFRKLGQALDTLGKTLDTERGVPFGVLPDGRFFFATPEPPTLALSVNDVQSLGLLTVSGDDAITEMTLIALSRASGTNPNRVAVYPPGYLAGTIIAYAFGRGGFSAYGLPYQPGTYTLKATSPGFEDYGLQGAAIVPDGADVLTRTLPLSDLTSSGFTGVANATDGSGTTYAANDGAARAPYLQFRVPVGADADPVVGMRAVYSLDMSGLDASSFYGEITLQYAFTDPTGATTYQAEATFDYHLDDTGGAVREVTSVRPLPAEFLTSLRTEPWAADTPTPYAATLNFGFNTFDGQPTVPAGRLKLYALEFIGLDRAKTSTIAQSSLRPPAQEPTEFKVTALPTALSSVTLTGHPGGDLVGDVAEIAGEHTAAGLTRLTIKLQQPGASEAARLVRLITQEAAAGAQTDLRGYIERNP
ncbi:hypothetical protein GCM10008959_26440 [Deinococcus seoulensis]|uniref:DUF4815 domain-containing protein n=1 Tax=Deinococcus seoulensis TaxID=1837379 RepID=A0ABQ2RSK3_9DEIO|nr:hypothetical protein [Deinococcus seoulensis]GGR63047.1 hypothetical protein GCM10008959_26440 [Deinococcus seoulensis]